MIYTYFLSYRKKDCGINKSFSVTADCDELAIKKLSRFKLDGYDGRIYRCVNPCDEEKLKVALINDVLLDRFDYLNSESRIASLCAKPENRATSLWVLDCDCSFEYLKKFCKEVFDLEIFEKEQVFDHKVVKELRKTKNNWQLITTGFDTRKLEGYDLIDNKKVNGAVYICLI